MVQFNIELVVDPAKGRRGLRIIRRQMRGLETAAGRVRSAILGAITLVGITAATRQIVAYADAFTNVQNRLRTVTTGTQELATATDELFAIADRTRSSFESTAELYARVGLAARDLGVEQQQLLQFTESVNQAVILSGASATEASAGLIQLAQGLGSGALRGDELRSVLEQLPVVADVIADSLGVTRGELRELGQEGKISAEIVLEAFKGAREELADRFGESVPTIGQSFTVLRNNVIETVGAVDQFTGASAGASAFVLLLAENVELLAVGLLILGVSALPAVITGVAAFVKQLAIARSIAASGAIFNPIVAGAAAAGAATLFFVDLYEKSIQRAVRETKALDDNFRELARGGDLGEIDTAIGNIEKTIGRIKEASDEGLIDPGTAAQKIAQLEGRIAELGQEFLALSDGSGRSLVEIRAQATAADELSDAVQGVIAAIEEENRLLALNAQERQIQVALSKAVAAAEREGGGPLNDEQRAALELAIRNNDELTRRAGLLERIKGPAREFEADLAQLDTLLRNGTISETEFNAELVRMAEGLGDVEELDLESILAGLEIPQSAVDRLRALIAEFQRAKQEADAAEGDAGPNVNTFVTPLSEGALGQLQAMSQEELFLAETQSNLNELLDAGAISADEYATAMNRAVAQTGNLGTSLAGGLRAGLAQVQLEMTNVSGAAKDLVTNGFSALEDSLVSFVTTGELDFSKFVDGLIADIARLIIRLLVLKAIEAIGGGAGSAASTASGAAGAAAAGALGGQRQRGGPVNPNEAVLVGEEGPELFTPRNAGNIVPAGATAAALAPQPAAPPVVNVSPTPVNVINVSDPSEIPAGMESADGEQAFMNIARRRRQELEGILGR